MSRASVRPRAEDHPMPPLPFGGLVGAVSLGAVAAGVVAAVVSWLLLSPLIRVAVAIEESREDAAAPSGHSPSGHSHSTETFGPGTQMVGGMLAAVLLALVLGMLFAVAFARLRPHLPGRTDFGRAAGLALAGFVVFALVPGIKYPANPPAVGDPATVGTRTLYYLTLVAAALVVTLAVFALRRMLPDHWPPSWVSTVGVLAAVLGYALLIGLWPATPDAIAADVPASLIWQFRLGSLAELAALWATLGLVSGLLLERRAARGQ